MAQVVKKSKKAIRRIENVKEDEDLEINPYLFSEVLEEADIKMGDKKYCGLRTVYSPEYYNYVYDNLFYMGHTYILNKDLTTHPSDPNWFTFKDSRKTSVVRNFMSIIPRMKCQYQSLDSVPGLLNLPEYIKSRVFDIAFSLCATDMVELPPDQMELEEKDIVDPRRLAAIQLNIRQFMENNTFTFYSKDRQYKFTIFCPLITEARDGYCILKFLRVKEDGEIDSKIYMIALRDVDDVIQKIGIELETGEVIDFYIKLGSKHGASNKYSSIGYYDEQSSELTTLNLPDDNPVDCVVCSMFTCGFLIQPDLTRYHNMFRNINIITERTERLNPVTGGYDVYKIDTSLEIILSPGRDSFITSIITSRIKSFYNFDNPSRPLKTIRYLQIYTKPPGPREVDAKSDGTYVAKNMNGITFYKSIYAYDPTKYLYAYGYNKTDFYKILDAFGLNQENCFIICGIPGHESVLTYRNGEYIMIDPQVNKIYTYEKYIEHNNMRYHNQNYIMINVILTADPREAILHGPEYPTLIDYSKNLQLYDGDIIPSLKHTVNHFSQAFSTGRPINDPPLRPVLGERRVEMILRRLDLSNTKSYVENIQEEIDTLDYENLCIIKYPNPNYSFRYYNKLESLLTRVRETFATADGLRGLRKFITKFYKDYGESVTEKYNMFMASLWRGFGLIFYEYSDKDIYNLLLQRPVFAVTARECLRSNIIQVDDLVDRIVTYLYEQNKPILKTSNLFYDILSTASREGIDKNIIRFLSRFRDVKLTTLDQLASRINRQLDLDHLQESIYQALKVLAQPSEDLVRKAKASIISQLANDAVLNRITARALTQFIKIHRRLLQKPSLLEDDVEEYFEPRFSAPLLDLAIHEFRLAKSLSYREQPIEDRKARERELFERIKQQREFEEPRTRAGREREREREIRRKKVLAKGLEEEEVVQLRLIRTVLEAMIEEKEEELERIDWSEPKYEKMLQERVSEIERFYHTENDRLDAFDVFISVMNIIKHKNIQLSKKYLGDR
jgi:hypothetical protein